MMLRVLPLALALIAGGCAHAPSCDPVGGTIPSLQCRAWSGDKSAQLELGRRYETGDGVITDMKQAAKLYRLAAQGTLGTTYVYSPPVGRHGRAMVLPVRTGVDRPGLAEAKYRLGVLYMSGQGVRRDAERGRRLIDEAQQLGFRPEAEDR